MSADWSISVLYIGQPFGLLQVCLLSVLLFPINRLIQKLGKIETKNISPSPVSDGGWSVRRMVVGRLDGWWLVG